MPDLAQLWNSTRRRLAWFGGAYALFVLILALPGAQKHALYAHRIQWPLWPRFDQPEKYGLAPGKTLDLKITTADGISLGAWFVFAEQFYHTAAFASPAVNLTESDITRALQAHNTILYFHGNAASRAAPHRVNFYSKWTSRANVNVLAIDYRGFADSEGTPSEDGLGLDAHAAWDWLVARGAEPPSILLFGQSLGTGVVAKLAYRLSLSGVNPRGAVMSGAFTDLATLLETYNIAGWIPLLQPLQIVPFFFQSLDHILYHKFSTISLFSDITCPLLLIHGEDDFDIQISHSEHLFDAALEPYLDQYPFSQKELSQIRMATKEQEQIVNDISIRRRQQRENLIQETTIPGLGGFLRFERPQKGEVNFLRSTWGAHNAIINYEGVMDVTRRAFNL